MPKSITITLSEKNYIKTALEQTFNISIEDSNDCMHLSSIIFDRFELLINYNTLRRLFRIIPSNSGVSLHSLNLIAKTLNFKSWSLLQLTIQENEIEQRNHFVQYFRMHKKINHESILQIINQLKLEVWEEAYWLKVIIKLAIDLEDYELINKILCFPFDLITAKDQEKLYFSLQDIFYELPQNKDLVNLLLNSIKDSPVIQLIFTECYVNEKYLNGYYGKLLDKFILVKNNDPKSQVFYNLLQCQKMYESEKNIEKIKPLFQEAFFIFNSLDEQKISSIIKGRLAAWEWILYEENTIYSVLVKQIKTKLDRIHFNDFYHRLIVKYSNNKSNASLIHPINNIEKNIKDELSFFAVRMYSHENLQFAIHYFLNNKLNEAKQWFLKVDPKYFDITMLDYYDNWYNKLKKELVL